MADPIGEKTIKELVQLGIRTAGPQEVGGVKYAIVPNDCRLESLEKFQFTRWAERQPRKQAHVKVLDAASFVEYYQKFCDSHSRTFADETKSCVLAVLDYHGAGENAPRWGDHKVELTLRHSKEWLSWVEKNSQANKMCQTDFAEFVEDNTPDFVEPKAATMLEMARTLQAHTDVQYESGIRMNNGQVQLTYNETVKGTYGSGRVEIPEQFVISIPVYVGTPRTAITARLRYRLVSGKLTIWYNLIRHEEVARRAFTETLEAIKTGIGETIINGNPA